MQWINEIPTVPIYYLAKPQPRCHRRGLVPTGPTGQMRWGGRCTCAEPWTGSTLSILLTTPRNSLTHRVPRTNGYVSQSLDRLTLYDSFVRFGPL
jgi:hypothetical protein